MTGTKYPLEGGRLIFSGTAKFGLVRKHAMPRQAAGRVQMRRILDLRPTITFQKCTENATREVNRAALHQIVGL